jgi:hypothetical protein
MLGKFHRQGGYAAFSVSASRLDGLVGYITVWNSTNGTCGSKPLRTPLQGRGNNRTSG